MKVIRKLLTPDEVTPPSIRWNEGTDTVEQTPDGGETWVETPELDPRHGAGFRRPPLTGEDARCNAAARQAAAWEEVYGIFMESTNALQFLAIILQILLALAGGVGVLIGLIFLIFDALIFIGKENMEAQFSEEVWDEIMCIIYRNIGEDGQISEAQLSDIYDEIGATYPGTVYNTLIEIGHLFGEVLLSNASVERGEIGDCDDCDDLWCKEVTDFSGWTQDSSGQGTISSVFLRSFVDTTITHVEFDWVLGGSPTGGTAALAAWAGDAYDLPRFIFGTDISTLHVEWDGSLFVGGLTFGVNGNSGSGGTVTITRLLMRGTGDEPFVGDDCP